jgi:hypothetical protein
VCVFVALGVQHAIRVRRNVICGLPRCTIFFHIYDFRRKKMLLNAKWSSLQLVSGTFLILRRMLYLTLSREYGGKLLIVLGVLVFVLCVSWRVLVFLWVYCCCTCCMNVLYYVCIAGVILDTELLASSQYSEGPATGHLDSGFSWFPCVYKQMLRCLPRFQVATTCFSCSPPDLKLNV